ncbi:MAG: glycosyltransferase family 4 protein [Bacteroidales bacterium]|jgi:glycosyltransferase involved in cell wall biosynthesis|nr:glycosyltransferase family 4 protein [Bacteroidales bacterium]
MNKQILFFYTTNRVGGTETNIIKIARELVHRGYDVHFVFLDENGPLLEQVDYNVFSITPIGNYLKHPFQACEKYRQLILQHNIDVVLNFGLKVECFSRLFSKKYGAKKIISNIRSTDNHRKWYHTFLDRLTQKNVDLWTSNSEAGKLAHHQREKVPFEKITVIPNFIDEVPKIVKQPSDILRIGTLANIFPYKGYFDMIPLAKLLIKKGLKFKFVIGGVDKTNGKFFEEIKKQNLDSFFDFKGYISDKATFFSEIDVFFLPSYLEGLPTVLLEAVMYETPVVASNAGGIPEIIINGETGYLYNSGHIEGYVEGIEKASDEKFKEQIIKNAKKDIMLRFSKDVCMKKWIDVVQI